MRVEMAPEDELCLLLARGQLSPPAQERARELLESPLRWDLLLERAREHQVFPLLYRNLRSVEFHRVPETVRAELRDAFRLNAAWNTFLAGELARVLRLLNESRVPVVPLKGVTLAESLYGDSAFRVCYDIDILVPPSDAAHARRLLLAHGYSSPFTEEFFVKHQLGTGAECPLFGQKQALSCLLEVHWTLLQHSRKDDEAIRDLWSQARPKDYFGVPAYALTPEWEFLYLAWHAAYHKWNTLKWLADIHQLCISAPIAWPQVREKTARFELDLIVGPTLTACAALFGTPAPSDLFSPGLPPGVHLFPSLLAPSQAWKDSLFYPSLLKRPSERLRCFAEMIFVPRLADARMFHLPSSLSFLYYLLRPSRLTCKWAWLALWAGFRRLKQWLRFSPP